MATLNLKHKRFSITESVSLVKNSKTGTMRWRHKFQGSRKDGSLGRQRFKDYRYYRFGSIEEFYNFIELKKLRCA